MFASNIDMAPDLLESVLENVRALGPGLKQRARQTEIDGRVSSETIGALRATGALVLTRPKRFGGSELGPSALIRLGYELGQHCGSTAWCASLANCNAWFASYWPLEAQQDIWASNEGAFVAGVAIPTGKAEPVDGGYRVSGRFPYTSNCDNSEWVFVSAAISSDGPAPAAIAWFLMPSAQVSIDDQSWQVSGLQGTGSKTLVLNEPVFVPGHRALMFEDVVKAEVPGGEDPENRLAGFGYTTFGATALVGPMLGMAKGALDSFVETIAAKLRITLKPGAPIPASANPFVQARIGASATMIEAAVALLLARLDSAEAKIDQGGELSIAERVGIRGALGFAARQSVLATNILVEAAGAASADVDLPLQRFWRDINTAGRHASLDTQALEALVGQELLGLPLMGTY